jgi:hypothetical protein
MRHGWEKAEGPCETVYTRRLKNGTVKGIDRGGQWYMQIMDGTIVPFKPRPGIHPLEAIDDILAKASALFCGTAMPLQEDGRGVRETEA